MVARILAAGCRQPQNEPRLGLPQIGYARKVEAADGVVRCERSMDDMIETLEAPLPAAEPLAPSA